MSASLPFVEGPRLVYRAHDPRWTEDPLSGEGAAKFGGRFNRVGTPALYTSVDFKTAWLEAQQAFLMKPQPILLFACEVACRKLVDLTNPEVLEPLGVNPEDLEGGWEVLMRQGLEPPTWYLAARLAARGAAGVLVPSFAPGADRSDVNVVFWRWQDPEECRVVLVDDQGRLALH